MAVPVVADADTLFGATTRGLLIHLDMAGVIALHWSPLILDEMTRALVTTGRKADSGAAHKLTQVMNVSCPGAEVSIVEVQAQFAAISGAVNSAKDQHVAACARAIVAGQFYSAPLVVALATKNLPDFDAPALAALDVVLNHPDVFLFGRVLADVEAVAAAFREFRLDSKTPKTPAMLLAKLAADGQKKTATVLGWAEQAGLATL